MFGWFRSKPVCPIDPAKRAWIDRRWAWLEEQFGQERLINGQVILPRPEFFPDPFHGKIKDARLIFNRVCTYMDIDPNTVELSFYEEAKPIYDGEMRQGSAGLYQQDAGSVHIMVEVSNLNNPLSLVATMAHELGHVHLLGKGRISDTEEDHEPLTDLLTVYLGLGVFSANSVVQESNWSDGQTSGWSIGRQGYLEMPTYGYAFARFARARGENLPPWAHELRLDVRSSFKESMLFLEHEDAAKLE